MLRLIIIIIIICETICDEMKRNLIPISHLKIYSLLDWVMREEICDLNLFFSFHTFVRWLRFFLAPIWVSLPFAHSFVLCFIALADGLNWRATNFCYEFKWKNTVWKRRTYATGQEGRKCSSILFGSIEATERSIRESISRISIYQGYSKLNEVMPPLRNKLYRPSQCRIQCVLCTV